MHYCPVAVTPQVNENCKVLLAGKLVSVIPVLCRLVMLTPDAGQLPAGTEEEQLTVVQLSPCTAGSRNTLPSAALGP